MSLSLPTGLAAVLLSSPSRLCGPRTALRESTAHASIAANPRSQICPALDPAAMSTALMRSAAALRIIASGARPHHADRCWRQISSTRTLQRSPRIASVTATAAAITAAAGTVAHCSSSQRASIHSSRDLSATPAAAVTPLDSKPDAVPTAVTADSSSAHAALLSFLSSHCRGISLSSSDIELLDSPRSFYSTLLTLTASAQRRIVLSSLYVGTGPDEVQLGLALRDRMKQAPELRVECLLDFLRGTRPAAKAGQESWAALAPLLSDELAPRFRLDLLALPPPAVPDQISPLRDWAERRWLTGVKTREARGVHHMKFYVFDDTVILSGANLSDTYFTTRQDRYVVIRSKQLADFYVQLQAALKAMPFCQRMTAQGLESKSGATERFGEEHCTGRNEWRKRQALGQQVAALFAPAPSVTAAESTPAHDTMVFPTLQMGTLGVTHDEAITSALFTLATTGRLPPASDSSRSASAAVLLPPPRSLVVATGYMNLTADYTRLLLAAPLRSEDQSSSSVRIVAASREANGWWGAKGGGRFVPELYAAAALSVESRSHSHACALVSTAAGATLTCHSLCAVWSVCAQ